LRRIIARRDQNAVRQVRAENGGIREHLLSNGSGAQQPDEPAASIRTHDRYQINVFEKKRENPSLHGLILTLIKQHRSLFEVDKGNKSAEARPL
jgi:hypothetical protein